MGSQKTAWLAELLDEYWNGGYLTGNLYGAALQAAVWEIVSEDLAVNPKNVTNGVFQLSGDSGVITEANTILSSIGAGHPLGGYVALSHPTGAERTAWQDYVVRVPLPGAVLLGLLGLGAAGLRRRRTE